MSDPSGKLRFVLSHLVHTDLANAALHCADVRYSPLTFRVAELLGPDDEMARVVLADSGAYEEDPGR